MLKNFLTTAYLLALTATPTQAYPIWAIAVAQSECEYLAMGLGGKTAFSQALRDNRHWFASMPDESMVTARILQATTYAMCPHLVKRTVDEWEHEPPAQPIKPAIRQEFEL